jgi:hypothetical protein
MKHLKRFNESSMSPIPTAEEYAKYMLPNGIDWYSEFGELPKPVREKQSVMFYRF